MPARLLGGVGGESVHRKRRRFFRGLGRRIVRREGRERVSGFPWLTALTLTPLAGGLIVVCLGARQKAVARALGLASSLVSVGLAVVIWTRFDPASSELQLVERSPWIPTLGIEYFAGADGVSLLMV